MRRGAARGWLRSGPAVCVKPPGACCSLRSGQVAYANCNGKPSNSGEAHSGEGLIREELSAGVGFRRGIGRVRNLRRGWRAGPGRAAHGTPCNSRKAVVSVPCMNAPANLIEHSLLVIRQVSLQATSAQSSTGTAMRRLAPLMRMPLRPVASARAGRRMFLDPFRVVAARRRVGSSKAPMRWRLGRRAAHRLPFFSVPATLGALGVELFHEATPFIRQRVRSICRSRR